MISALLLFAFLPGLASQIAPPYVPEQEPFLLPAADSAAVRQIYGIGVFANPASKASVSVDSGILRAEFTLASDSTEGYSVNVGLTVPLNAEGIPVNLGRSGGAPLVRFQCEYRLSERVTDALDWWFETTVPPVGVMQTIYTASVSSKAALTASTDWKPLSLNDYDFDSGIRWFQDPGFPLLDSFLTQATALRVQPKTFYQDSGSQKGMRCTKCVNPTMKHLVMELRQIQIDRLGPAGDTISLVLGQPKSRVGVSRHMAVRPADISWQGGLLEIANPTRWASVTVLGLDGRRLRTLPPAASQRLDLPPGSYRVLLRGRDGDQAVRNLIRLH